MSVRLSEGLATTEALAEAFSDAAVLGAMLRFEVALARAESRLGVIPASAADVIASVAGSAAFDAWELARAARSSGTIVIPFVDALRSRVHSEDPEAAAFVHWGATSQDVSDTALVLCLATAWPLVMADHDRLAAALTRLSDAHAHTVMVGRTLLQPAPPITFGLKAAGWFGAVTRSAAHMRSAFEAARLLQFGGSTGTLGVLGEAGGSVAEQLARELHLHVPDAPWHAHRDRFAAWVACCGVYVGALSKIARDVSLLMQVEVGEAAEPGGASSAMPHKHNPAGCAIVLAAAARTPGLVAAFLGSMAQEHERGVGDWHAEWPTVSAVVQTTGSAVAAMAHVIETLTVNPERMRANLDATRGAIFAEHAMVLLAPLLGRDAATRAIVRALEITEHEGRQFSDALASDHEVTGAVPADALSSLGRADSCLGSAEEFRQRLLGRTAK